MVRRISKSEIAGVLEQWRVGSLIKFVTQRVYAEQLIQGIPYLQAIDEFRSKRHLKIRIINSSYRVRMGGALETNFQIEALQF